MSGRGTPSGKVVGDGSTEKTSLDKLLKVRK